MLEELNMKNFIICYEMFYCGKRSKQDVHFES